MAEHSTTADESPQRALASRFAATRQLTENLAAPLSAEDQTVQSMPDVSPTKWHRAHTSWFFETFLLAGSDASYREFHPAYQTLFNSYYQAVGSPFPRGERGLVSRPGIEEIRRYRAHVDAAMFQLLEARLDGPTASLVDLGINHEQQHQELLLMDIKHVLSRNPLQPAYADLSRVPAERGRPAGPPTTDPDGASSQTWSPGWAKYPGGSYRIGHDGQSFGFDNEFPRHEVHLEPFALADQLVTCGEWRDFIDDDGYHRPELWLSDGWIAVQEGRWESPLYWSEEGGRWTEFTLGGPEPVHPGRPVCHISYYEADAFARWADARLPTEAEWEVAADGCAEAGHFLDPGSLHPRVTSASEPPTPFGDCWQWTSSAYSPYPGFTVSPGAVGEYNGKFMVSQYVLRGGSCVTPADHIRATYRNFFPPSARWVFSGLRLARDA